MSVSSQYANLGKSGLKTSKVIVGCMSFGDKRWFDWVIEDEEKAFAVLKKCYDSGIRTFDTANAYSNGGSEILLGKFLKKYDIKRDRVVIMSKVFFPIDEDIPNFNVITHGNYPEGDYINTKGLSRKHILDSARASVERLGTYMDVFQIHRFDISTPIEETMEALHDTVKLGYTRYIGASTMKAYQFVMMQEVANRNRWTKFICMQNYYNLINREEEREMIAYCKETGVGLIPWSPNARGFLTRPLDVKSTDSTRQATDGTLQRVVLDTLTEGDKEINKRVEKIAKDKGVNMASVATAWVLSKGCYPIVGFSRPERVDDAIAAMNLELTEEDIKYMEEPYISKEPVK
ncbi:hypothetical protein POJ06DRAFT_19479 [Lipomyces tetrasporus]|uniref:NADP-dependent oxidoreductase domain-containing protein n=1 Tax=Lipomyces tetrasporus TaxID=54092 RepID=A0AAD7QPW1_9ASCO|nr:uncharacterized protein POJ06DRAFT_19479 [Lipomyces tetrasporus]KAJ8097667.1 hypothetical protein POJ06DRAFT_19479 [Lipomyces tetrasporus]